MVEISLTAQIEIRVDEDVAAVFDPGRLAELGFAYLVTNRHRPVRRDELAEVLWGDELPRSWEQLVRGVVAQIRAVLQSAGLPAKEVLTTAPGSYRLDLAEAAVDVEKASAGVLVAERALAAGDPATAAREAEEAARIASRRFLPAAGGGWVERRQAELEETHLRALDALARASQVQGDWKTAVQAAERAITLQPYRESAYVRLMLAHASGGNRAEALRAYERCRRNLAEALGVDPSPETQDVYLRFLGTEPSPGASAPPPATVAGLSGSSDAGAPCGAEALPMPLPPLLARTESLPLVGRNRELSELDDAYHRAAEGSRRVVLLAGEPGSGKTRLVAEAAGRALARGAVVLAGRCDEGMAVPYQPFLEALRDFVDHSCNCHLAARLGRWPGELTRLVPDIAARVPQVPPPGSAEPETARYRLFEAVASWLASASAERPVLLVLDDLQWAAKPTILLLRHVLRSSDPMRLAVLATYRDTEVPWSHPLGELMSDLRDDPGVQRLELGGLDADEVGELVATTTGRQLTSARAWAKAIHADTRGNPFFVAELARYLAQGGAFDRASVVPSSALAAGIPEGVHDVVSRRLSRLGGTTAAVLSTASVMGLEFDPAVVERASGLTEEPLVSAIEEATAARLVEEVVGPRPRYRFAHALVRASVYDRITRLRRAVLHRRVGEALESIYGSDRPDLLPDLARHFAAAAHGGPSAKAAAYARGAGDHALFQLANDEAVVHYRAALSLLDHAATEPSAGAALCDVLLSLGEAEARAGEATYRRTLLDAAELAQRLGDSDRLATAALSISRGRYSAVGEVDRERVEVLRAAVDALPAEDSTVRARLLAYQGVELTWSGDWQNRVALSDAALAMARRIGDPETLTLVLHLRYMTLWAASTLTERLAISNEARELASGLGDRTLEFHAAYSGCYASMEMGDMDSADRLLASAQHLAGELHQPLLAWRVLYTRGARAAAAGAFEEAERLAFESLAVGQRAGQPDAARALGTQLFTLRFHQGRLDELVAMAEGGFVEPTDSGSLQWASRMALAVVYREMGRRDDAWRVFEAVLADDLRDVPNDYGWLPTVALGAFVCSYLGDARRAQRLHALLEPYGEQCVCVGPGWLGSTAHYLALTAATMGERAEADRHFAVAAETHAKAASPVWQAHTALAWAELLLESGDQRDAESAQELLRRARRTGRRLGMRSTERRALSAAARG